MHEGKNAFDTVKIESSMRRIDHALDHLDPSLLLSSLVQDLCSTDV